MLLIWEFTSLAYKNEYYDQAHFIKDFRDLVFSNAGSKKGQKKVYDNKY